MMRALKPAMKNSISNILETMFYMPLTFDEKGRWEDYDTCDLSACGIDFTGSVSGSLLVVMPPSLLVEMTENFTGSPPEQMDRRCLDETLGEIVNMVAGHALSSMDELSDFHLGIPRHIEKKEAVEAFPHGDPSGFHLYTRTPESFIAFKVVTGSFRRGALNG